MTNLNYTTSKTKRKEIDRKKKNLANKRILTREGNGATNSEDTGFTAVITEFSVRITREDFAAVTAEDFDGGVRSDHAFSRFGYER